MPSRSSRRRGSPDRARCRRPGRGPRRRRPRARLRGRPAARPAARTAGRAGPGHAPRGRRSRQRPARRRRRRRAPRGPPPLPGRSPRHAGPPTAGHGSRRLRPVGAGRRRSRPPRARGGRRRRASSRGSIASSASAARFARQRSTDVGHRGTGRGVPAERVEQVALPALIEQALLVVLAVDLDQRPDLVGEPRCGRGDRRRAGRSTGRWSATSRTAISGSGSRSNSASTRAASAPWRTRVVSARDPAHQPEGIDQQALAGAGLAGDDVEARPERQAQPVDQRQVGDGQLEQAAARSASALTRAAARPCGAAGPRTAARPPAR